MAAKLSFIPHPCDQSDRLAVSPGNLPSAALQDQTDKFVPAELPDWLFKTIEDALAVYDA